MDGGFRLEHIFHAQAAVFAGHVEAQSVLHGCGGPAFGDACEVHAGGARRDGERAAVHRVEALDRGAVHGGSHGLQIVLRGCWLILLERPCDAEGAVRRGQGPCEGSLLVGHLPVRGDAGDADRRTVGHQPCAGLCGVEVVHRNPVHGGRHALQVVRGRRGLFLLERPCDADRVVRRGDRPHEGAVLVCRHPIRGNPF